MGNGGYIKLYRKFRDHPYYRQSGFSHLWLHILLNAQYQAGIRVYRGKSIALDQGEFVFGRRQFARETGLSERRVRTLMSLLSKEKMISPVSHKATHLFSVFLVENWVEYQENRPTNRPTSVPQTVPQTVPQIPVDNGSKPSHKATHETPTYKEDIREEERVATGVPTTYIEFARSFLEKQKERFPKESAWEDFEARVAEGAKSLHLFHTQNGWTEDEIRNLLDWIQGDEFWSSQIRTLGSIRNRKKGKGTPMKFENVMADMRRGGLSPNGGMTYEQVLQAMHDENIPMTDFKYQEGGTWLRK